MSFHYLFVQIKSSYFEDWNIAAQLAPAALTGSPESQSEFMVVSGLPLAILQTPLESFRTLSQILSPPYNVLTISENPQWIHFLLN